MYIHSLVIKNLRCFKTARLTFQYPGRNPRPGEPPVAALDNVTLLLGNNGLGKSTILKGIAMALTAPVLRYTGFHATSLVRRVFTPPKKGRPVERARVDAEVLLRQQDGAPVRGLTKELFVQLERKGTVDAVVKATLDRDIWEAMFHERSPAFLVLGYGTTRWSAPREENTAVRQKQTNLRYQRIRGLFDDGVSLIPLAQWFPSFTNSGRRRQVVQLLDKLLGHYEFKGEVDESGELLLRKGDARIPLPALSDGYRAFVGWVGDFIYHLCMWAGTGKRLDEMEGVVMVDEIDLHLHPDWQRSVITTLSQTLPRIQFIFTSHSPLVTGSLEWPNLWVMAEDGPRQLPDEPIHGLSADQVLLSPYFGVSATRSDEKMRRLSELDLKAQQGDVKAAHRFMKELSTGMESEKYGAAEPAIKANLLAPPVAANEAGWEATVGTLAPPKIVRKKKIQTKK